MMRLSQRIKLWLLAVGVVCLSLITIVNYSDACRLQSVSINGDPVKDWNIEFAMLDSSSIAKQPLNDLARSVLNSKKVYRVDVEYDWPHSLEITTDRYTPVCFGLDGPSGRLFGMNEEMRALPLKHARIDWERPVLTSINVKRIYGLCTDPRVAIVGRQLEELRDEEIDFYRLVDEIDFGNPSYLTVTVSGLPYRIKLHAQSLLEDLNRFVEFSSRFAADLDNVRYVDVRFDNMVVCDRGKR